MKSVTDTALIAQLEGGDAPPTTTLKPVTDPAMLAQLEAAPVERSLPEKLGRQVGLTVRAGIQGVTAIPATLANAPAALYNKLADFFSPQPASGQPEDRGFRFPEQQTAIGSLLTKLGLPAPENATERVAGDVAGAMAGAGGMVKAGEGLAKAASPIVQRVGQVLASSPGTQIATSATGSATAGVTRERGGGPIAQIAAGAAGGFAPAIPAAASAAARNLLRGGETGRQQVADMIMTFEDAGAGTPTVGQATQGRGASAVESTLAKTPGSAGRMIAKAESESAGVGSTVEDMAAQLAAKSGAAPAGRQIKGGLEHFVEEFKAKSGQLYDALDRYIPPDTQIPASNTLAKVAELTKPIAGAESTSALLQTPKLAAVKTALENDAAAKPAQPILSTLLGADGKPIVTGQTLAQPGGIPYQALKELRSAVGAKIANPSLTDDVPTGQWKQLYGALSSDLGAAARAAGPEAEAAMVRATNHYRAGMKRIEDVLQPIVAKGDPEDIFTAALSGTKEGATTLQGVMKSLPAESRKVVAATALRRLGLATPGKQNELGEVFSTESFLTNWNKLHPDAKTSLFSSMPNGMRADLDKVASVASNIREGSKVFANPSGTAQASTRSLTAGAAAIAALTGQWGTLGAIGGSVAAANGLARLMTNPTVVHWLAESTKVPISQLPAQLNILGQASWSMDREDKNPVQGFIRKMRAAVPEASVPVSQ